MTTVRSVHLHDGRCLWPQHKPLDEVMLLKETTRPLIFSGTYQGLPTPPGGYIFKRAWWNGPGRRYSLDDQKVKNLVYGRWLSFDTANKAKDDNDYSAYSVVELWPDYRLGLRYAQAERWEFPQLPQEIEAAALKWNYDEKLKGILIEDKQSGTSALQTLAATSPNWLRPLLIPFMPTTDKVTRAEQAAVWCKNGSVLLPYVGQDLHWLIDFEDQLFNFPQATYDDLTDSFSQVILYLENLLEHGYHARGGAKET